MAHRDVGDEEEAQGVEGGQARLGGLLGGGGGSGRGGGLSAARSGSCGGHLAAGLLAGPEGRLHGVAARGGKARLPQHAWLHLQSQAAADGSLIATTTETKAAGRLHTAGAVPPCAARQAQAGQTTNRHSLDACHQCIKITHDWEACIPLQAQDAPVAALPAAEAPARPRSGADLPALCAPRPTSPVLAYG